MFDGEQDLAAIVEDVARVGARLLLQTALEAEIDEFLGRSRYQRSATAEDARPGMRNGYHEITVKTTAGPVRLARPKLRGTTEAFASRLLGAGVSKSNALESLVIAGFVRGLSVRDVQATLAEALGAEAALSKSTASRICQQIAEQFDTWRTRRLDLLSLDYLFLDGSHFKMHPGSPAEPILAAWGITTDGKPVLVGLEVAASEGADAWDGFLDGLADRGLRAPLLAISDGAAGLMGAIERNLPHTLRQRCLVHRARNLLAKVPKNAQEEVKAAYWAIFDVPFPGLGRARPRLRRLARVHHDPRRAAPAARPAPPTPRPANRVPPTTRGATRRTRRRHPSRNRHSRGKHAQRDDHVRRHLHHTWEATARPDHMTARSNQPLARNSSVAWDSRAVHEPEAGSRVGQGERDRP